MKTCPAPRVPSLSKSLSATPCDALLATVLTSNVHDELTCIHSPLSADFRLTDTFC